MTALDRGVALHVHHDILAEVCLSKAERLAAIRRDKPAAEVPTRERLLQIIPPKLLPTEVRRAFAAWVKAVAARVKAEAAWVKAEAAWVKAEAAWEKAEAAWEKAEAAREKAEAVILAHRSEMEALHRRLCPNCPWDGKTIFPARVTP